MKFLGVTHPKYLRHRWNEGYTKTLDVTVRDKDALSEAVEEV
jgi:hypothetical protein